MAEKYVSLRNLKFILHEILDIKKINSLPRYQDYDAEAFDMALDAAKDLADKYLFPFYQTMDKNKAYFDTESGEVKVHPELKKSIKAIADAGWLGAYADYDLWGQQMPSILHNSAMFIMHAANANMVSYATLTDSASNLIRSFGTEEQKHYFIPKMVAGEWQGTMALTEPQAGSSLSDITTTAIPNEDGSYQIKGQKIYISGGDYENVNNVVHLLLARIKGAPAGTKGISLFIVPKYREVNGEMTGNDVITAGIYGKMGQKGYVATHLMFGENDNCTGYLVGTPHRGLPYMFQMMNEARIGVGIVATACASGAYYASLQYAKERAQGRHPSNKDLAAPQVLIIEHADVRRMLLFQKSVIEGSIALAMLCSYYVDIVENTEGDEKDNAHLILELLTPIVKSFPSEFGNQSVSAGLQVLGGAGYTDDFPLEQYFRDMRINAIYEGTTTIHGKDLLGRKLMMKEGKAFKLLAAEMMQTLAEAKAIGMGDTFVQKFSHAFSELQETTLHLIGLAQKERPEVFLSDATLYLEFFGIVTVSWLWLKQGIAAQKALEKSPSEGDHNFYQGKIFTMKYYFEYELPKIRGLKERLLSSDRLTLDVKSEYLD